MSQTHQAAPARLSLFQPGFRLHHRVATEQLVRDVEREDVGEAVQRQHVKGLLDLDANLLDAEHDCLEEVEFEIVEDWDCFFTIVKCEVCGTDVSEEYEDLYGDEDYEDDYFEAMRELQYEGGDE